MNIKLNVLLAKTDHLAAGFKGNLKDYIVFFKKSQGAFRGEVKTYEPAVGTIDEPGKRGTTLVQTTVDEKLDWLENAQADYINALFSQEKTNASGNAKTGLKVGDVEFGEFTSLELLRLKSILEGQDFKDLYSEIPVRSDSEIWNRTDNPLYARREVFESPKTEGDVKSTLKENYILQDPNISGQSPAYKASVAVKDTVIVLGHGTFQKFTGEWTHLLRAEALRRRDQLLTAVIAALKVCNEVEAIESEMTAKKLFGFIRNGSIS